MLLCVELCCLVLLYVVVGCRLSLFVLVDVRCVASGWRLMCSVVCCCCLFYGVVA